jgi:hypothetical protein
MANGLTRKQSPGPRWISWVLWALALAPLIYLAGLTVWLGVVGLFFPYQLDYGEGVMLHFVKEWSQGHPIYRTGGSYPYITSNYAPLTIVLALALTPVLGISYATGRIWTLLAVFAASLLILAWVRRESGRWLPAIVVALLFVGSPYIYHWAPLFRVDLVGLALTLGGLYAVYVATRWSGRQGPGPSPSAAAGDRRVPRGEATQSLNHWLIWLAVILFVAALFAKQSFFFAPAAAVIYLFLFVDRGLAVRMAMVIAALGGGLFLTINALTSGGFWYGLVASNVNPFLWPEFWKQQADFVRTFGALGLLAAWYLVDKFWLDRAILAREKVSPLDLYLPAALASLLLAGKAGAWENYFFEALAALAVCGGLGLARLARHGTLLYRFVAPLLVLVQVVLMWHGPQVAQRYLQLTRESNEAMIPILAETPDPILSEDMGLLVTNDKTLDYYAFQNSQLARAGRWDQSWELDQLRGRKLSLVVMERGTRLDVDRYQRFTREFLSALDRNYRLGRTVGKFELYRPDPLQHERRVEYDEELALVGWSVNVPPDLEPGEAISLTVVWQAQQPMVTDYTAFAHLVDEGGQGWAGDDHQPHNGLYPTSAWGAGEMVRDSFTLTIPDDAPPGLYDVEVGWYDPVTGERLPVNGGSAFRVAVLPVDWDTTPSENLEPADASFGGLIALQGYSWEIESGLLRVTLRLSLDEAGQARPYLDRNYTVFIHVVPAEGRAPVVAQSDQEPLGGRWPTLLSLPGMALDASATIPLSDLEPGIYSILVGLYEPATGGRLTLSDGSDAWHLTDFEWP